MNDITINTESPKKEKRIGKIKIPLVKIPHAIRKTIIILLIALLASSVVYFFIIEFHQKYIDESSPVYSYTCNTGVAYQVFLLPNEIIPEKSMEEDGVYITKFVDYIGTTFNFVFSGDKDAELKGTYSATAYLQGIIVGVEEDKILWTKEYKLYPEKSFTENNSSFAVDYKVPIDYRGISAYAEEVKKLLDISSNIGLTIVYNISIQAETSDGVVSEEFAPSIVLPISDEYFQITKNPVEEKTGSIDVSEKAVSPVFIDKMIWCLITITLFVLALLYMIYYTEDLLLSPQQYEINRIFKKYGSRIVTLGSDIQPGKKEIAEVLNFDGLVRTADDLGKPIFYNNKGDSSSNINFFVLDDKVNYMFNLENSLDKVSQKCENN